jgi:hypothetical protein
MMKRRYGLSAILIAICFTTTAIPGRAQEQTPRTTAHTTPLPRDAQFTAGGMLKPAINPLVAATASASQPAALDMKAVVSGPGPYGLPALPVNTYNPTAITATLNDLMNTWHPAQAEYAAYFMWMPSKVDVIQEAKNLGVLLHPNTIYHINYYNVSNDVGIAVESLGTTPFVGAGFTPTPEDTIFVVLDSFSAPVPVAVARTVQQDFASGFVTRLVLDAYVSAAQLPNHGNYAGLKGLSLSLNGKFKANSGDFSQFVLPATYTNGNTLAAAIATSEATQPIISDGLLLGWKAADELLSIDSASGNHRLQKDAWALLNFRYTFEELGTMTGFTLNYLSGEAMNERIVSLLSTNPPPPSALTPGTAGYAQALLQQAASSNAIRAGKQFLVSFGNVMDAEFYAVTQNKHLKKDEKQLLLARYFNFTEGYRRGLNKAASIIYEEITGQTYDLAYADGFRDGYSLGYAAGWKDGYAQGNAVAWQQANAIIAGLQSQISSLQSQLNNANGGGGGFWGDVGGVLNDVGTAIGIIGSFF